jgi:hypothetical protein
VNRKKEIVAEDVKEAGFFGGDCDSRIDARCSHGARIVGPVEIKGAEGLFIP